MQNCSFLLNIWVHIFCHMFVICFTRTWSGGLSENLFYIQFVPNIYCSFLHQPAENIYHLILSCCCLNSTGPQINFKSERNTQIFYSEQIISCKNRNKGANFFNWERPIVQCIDIVVVLDDNLLQMPSLEIWLEYAERHSGMLLSQS